MESKLAAGEYFLPYGQVRRTGTSIIHRLSCTGGCTITSTNSKSKNQRVSKFFVHTDRFVWKKKFHKMSILAFEFEANSSASSSNCTIFKFYRTVYSGVVMACQMTVSPKHIWHPQNNTSLLEWMEGQNGQDIFSLLNWKINNW